MKHTAKRLKTVKITLLYKQNFYFKKNFFKKKKKNNFKIFF